MPTPTAPPADDSHQRLLDQLDLVSKPKPFRNPAWRHHQRRNKNIKQVISEAQRKEASVMATQNNSGATTPAPEGSAIATRAVTPQPSTGGVSLTAQSLSTMVLEKNLQAQITMANGPVATYSNIESAPSLHPASQKHYCDITGLPADYTDPKSRLRYVDGEVFEVVRGLPQGVAEQYLEARAANVILK